MSEEVVLYTVVEGVATITLNRPDTLNAMNNPLMSGITDCINRVRDDESVRVVVITGAGRGFCAGADLGPIATAPPSPISDEGEDTFNNAIRAIDTCPVPTVARVNGAAAGGGFGLALSCDITVAAESAFFVATFGPKLGIVPDMGVTWNVPMRVGRARALGINLLGDRITATQAEDWGLIWKAVADADLDAEIARVTGILQRSSPATSTRIRDTINAAPTNTLSDQLDLEMKHQAVLIPRNMQEGAAAFMEKREPQFDGERNL